MASKIEISVPTVAPTGFEVTRDGVRAVWDVFVKPTQSDDAPPQSIEDRMLGAILRAVYAGLPPTVNEPESGEKR